MRTQPWVLAAMCLVPLATVAQDVGIGIEIDDKPDYPAKWAIVIGVNYSGRTLEDPADRYVLPPLSNAEADATAIFDLLIDHYGYPHDNIVPLI